MSRPADVGPSIAPRTGAAFELLGKRWTGQIVDLLVWSRVLPVRALSYAGDRVRDALEQRVRDRAGMPPSHFELLVQLRRASGSSCTG